MRGHGIVRACLGRTSTALGAEREVFASVGQSVGSQHHSTTAIDGPPAEKNTETARGRETLPPAAAEYRAAKAFKAKFEGWRAPDPAVGAMVQRLSGQNPGLPPGAYTPRVQGSHEPVASLHYDPIGPWGVTTGPGRGPEAFERMQRRHKGASATMLHTLASAYAWHQPAVCPPAHSTRVFNKRVEANPGGANVEVLDEQAADSTTVVDEAVKIFENREDVTEHHAAQTVHRTSTSSHINPPSDPVPLDTRDPYNKKADGEAPHSSAPSSASTVERMDEGPASAGAGALGSAAQKAAGEAQAESMSTRGFISPDRSNTTNTAPAAGDVPEADPAGAFSKEAQTAAAEEQVAGMSTAGSIKTRGFFTAPTWFAGGTPPPDPEGPDVLAARKHSRDSYAESDLKGAEPVDVGAVGNLNSGVNILGGTPIKPQSERMTQENQLHRDTESMTPEIPEPTLVDIGPQSSGGAPADKVELACGTDELFHEPFQMLGMEESGFRYGARKSGRGMGAHSHTCTCAACQRSAHGPFCGCQTCSPV